MKTKARLDELQSALEYADSTGDTDSIIQIQRELIDLNAANLRKEFVTWHEIPADSYPAEVVR